MRALLTHSPRFRFLLILLLFVGLLPSMVQAFTLSPVALDINVEKRDLQTRDITLTNGDGYARVYATVHEIDLDESGEIKAFSYATNEDRQDTVTSWLEINRGRITLEPNEVRTIPLTIRINPNAKPGLYHAFVSFANAPDKYQAQKRALAGKTQGVIVRISIDQERTEFSKLSQFFVDRFVTDPAKEVVHYSVSNTGQAEIVPSGEIILSNNRGNEVGSIQINPDAEQIDPEQSQTFSATLPDGLKAGKYKAFMTLEYGAKQKASLTDTSYFYMMPLSTMIIIFVVVLLFAIGLTVLIYRRTQPVADHDATADVAMYLRQGVSESHDHDIDLKNQNNTK